MPVDSRDSAPSAGTTALAKPEGAPTLSLRLSTTFSLKNLRPAAAASAAWALLSGDALYEAAAGQIRAGLGKDFPPGWQFKPEISVKPAAAPVDATVCQQLFAELLGKARIRFESGKADIVADSSGLLDRLIETALRCPTANIEISGHTDTDGDEAANQGLSERRAQAVADYLVKAGLPANRFSAVGYGSTQPIAGNDTDQGKAQNRRIDFVVK